MRIFPTLPVLSDIASALEEHHYGKLFEGTVFVCVQHLLESSGSLFESIIRLGALPSDIFVLGKRYSSNTNVLDKLRSLGIRANDAVSPRTWHEFSPTFDADVRRLWDGVIQGRLTKPVRQLVVLDDGGHCILHVPRGLLSRSRVVAVEQTTSGIRKIHTPRMLVVDVASSAVKKYIEAPLVAETVFRKALDAAPELRSVSSVGIIGLGNIGLALASVLNSNEKRVFAYDSDPKKLVTAQPPITPCNTVVEVLRRSDVIFGCTGENLGILRFLGSLGGKKILISCSSEDREFHSLIDQFYKNNPKSFSEYDSDIRLKFGPTEARVIRGGFPVNFDRQPESVPNNDIQITRGLLLGAAAQAVLFRSGAAQVCNLDASLQRFALSSWFEAYPEKEPKFATGLLSSLESVEWIESESGKFLIKSPELAHIFRGEQHRTTAATGFSSRN